MKPYRTTKRLTISRFPKVLALHIQRSVYLASGRAVKNSCRVGGFGEFWDASLPGARRRSGIFARHDSSDATKQLFRLQSVVLHYGSHDSGHFVTYRRMPARRYGELADWSRVEESLDKIARGQDPQGRLAAWIEEWCNAASNGRLGASEREEATESNESSDPDAKEQVIASDLALRSSAEQLIAPTVPAELDSGSKALKVDTSPAKLEPGPDGESPTLHGSADEDNAIDTALDTDTDPGLSGEGDLANGVPELTVTTFAPLAEDGKTLSTSFAHAAKSTRLKTTRAPDRWFRISDETVELVDDPEREIYDMVSSQAYMIYFEREE